MRSSIGLIGLLGIVFMSSLSCAEQHKTWSDLSQQNGASLADSGDVRMMAANALTVVDENQQPISGATILIGYEPGNPFPGNQVTTGADGAATIPADWKAVLPLTVEAPGYVTTTLPLAEPSDHIVRLNRQEGSGKIEVKGTATDFGRLISDGKVDFSLLLASMKRSELLSFNMSTVLSPEIDVIELLGNQVPLPSNITLPRQVESFIFPVELNKPDYRVYYRDPGQYLVSALHGQFPMQRVINEIRAGKSIFDLLNQFTILERGQVTHDVQGNLAGVNVAVNQTRFDTFISVKAPDFPATQVMYSLALDEQGPVMSPTDVKRFAKNETIRMKTYAASTPSVLAVLAQNASADINPLDFIAPRDGGLIFPSASDRPQQNFTQSSLALMPASNGAAPQFLPLIPAPAFANGTVTAQVPALPAGLTAAAMVIVYSEIEDLPGGSVKNERRTRLWEIWSDVWAPRVQLPKIEFARDPGKIYRWEVMFLARTTGAASSLDPSDLNTVTHVTRNALDL